METLTCIKNRRTIRKFTNEQVTDDVLKDIIDAAICSPSWKNSQICRYTVIKSRDVMNNICDNALMGFAHNAGNISTCSALVVISYKNGRCGYERDGSFTTSKGDRWQMFDAGIVTQTFSLAAWDKGVGSVIMGIFDDAKIAEIVNLPEDETAAVLIAVGYPDQEPAMPPRNAVDDVVRFL